MIQCNTVNVSLWNSQLNKLKSATKYTTDVTLWLSSNIFGDGETNFPHKLLLTGSQHKIFQNTTTKIIQSGGFFARLLAPLQKAGLPSMKNVLKPLAKSALIPLQRLNAAASQSDEGIHKKSQGPDQRH